MLHPKDRTSYILHPISYTFYVQVRTRPRIGFRPPTVGEVVSLPPSLVIGVNDRRGMLYTSRLLLQQFPHLKQQRVLLHGPACSLHGAACSLDGAGCSPVWPGNRDRDCDGRLTGRFELPMWVLPRSENKSLSGSYILHPTCYILHPTSYILPSYMLHPTSISYLLHSTFYILHSISYILHPTSYILHPTILHPAS